MLKSPPAARFAPALALLLIAGCGSENRLPTSVLLPARASHVADSAQSAAAHSSDERGAFYPLSIGNRWRYAGSSMKKIGNDAKSGHWTRETSLARFVERNGHTYVEQEITVTEAQQQVHGIAWLRQDRLGLFELSVPPPGAPPDYESMLLAYPLHRGVTWTVGNYAQITATVDGAEVLNTPAGRFPAWRIRLCDSGHDPREVHFAWYGRAGYLGMKRHLQYEIRGTGGVIFEAVEDEAEWVQAVDLAHESLVVRR